MQQFLSIAMTSNNIMTEKLAFPFDSIITRQSHKLGIYLLFALSGGQKDCDLN